AILHRQRPFPSIEAAKGDSLFPGDAEPLLSEPRFGAREQEVRPGLQQFVRVEGVRDGKRPGVALERHGPGADGQFDARRQRDVPASAPLRPPPPPHRGGPRPPGHTPPPRPPRPPCPGAPAALAPPAAPDRPADAPPAPAAAPWPPRTRSPAPGR